MCMYNALARRKKTGGPSDFLLEDVWARVFTRLTSNDTSENPCFGDPRREYRDANKGRAIRYRDDERDYTSRAESVQLRDACRGNLSHARAKYIRGSIFETRRSHDVKYIRTKRTKRTSVRRSGGRRERWISRRAVTWNSVENIDVNERSALQHTLHKENGVLWNHEYDNDVVTCSSPPLSTECNTRYTLAIADRFKGPFFRRASLSNIRRAIGRNHRAHGDESANRSSWKSLVPASPHFSSFYPTRKIVS